MNVGRLAAVAALAAVGGGLLTGCDIHAEFGDDGCSTSPPVPHHNFGAVVVDASIPLYVEPGGTFTVTVQDMFATVTPASSQPFGTGTISVSGPVTPSGTFSVGQGIFGGTPFPNTLTFTATGQDGDVITFSAVDGSSFEGTPPNGVLLTCSGHNGEIGTTTIKTPDSPSTTTAP